MDEPQQPQFRDRLPWCLRVGAAKLFSSGREFLVDVRAFILDGAYAPGISPFPGFPRFKL
jgi:hypothetical protein